MLLVIATHPIQYLTPVYRVLHARCGIPLTAVFGSDFSVAGYYDQQFGTSFAWDTDLLSGYDSVFLARVAEGGARSVGELSIKGFKRILEKIRPAAVLVGGYSPRFHQLAFYTAWRYGAPLLFRGETTDLKQPRGLAKRWVRVQVLRWYYSRFQGLLYIGQHSLQHFKGLGCPEHKLTFSPYCVDTSHFQCKEVQSRDLRHGQRQALGIEESRIVIVFSGKLYEAKGPELLLRALKQLEPVLRERLEVLFLGDGEMRAQLERFAGEVPTVRAHFAGFQNQTRLSGFYQAGNLLALPSFSETWGLVVNEALHHGLPCVVSDAVGCAPDLVEPGRTGEVFRNRSVEDLARAITRAVALARRPEIRALCRAKVDSYSVEKAARGIAAAYERVAGAAGHRGTTPGWA